MKPLRTSASVALAFSAVCLGCTSDDTPGNETYSREKLMDPQTCAECHPKHHEEWSGSMHAYASSDPVFLAMNRRGQEETNGELAGFCVNCHAPLAVQEGATTDGLNMESVPKHLQGITCYFCHQVNDVAEDHLSNNPLLLANDVTMRGSLTDPVDAQAHRSEYSPFLDNTDLHQSSRMCGTCHDIVVPGHFSHAPTEVVPLEQTYAEWLETAFAQPGIGRQSCGDCHVGGDGNGEQPIAEPPNSPMTMPQREVRHQHRFFAIDTALTDFPDKTEQARLVQDGLDKSLLATLCVSQTAYVEVTLENLLAGHNFPSGASHDRRLWAELHVYDGDRDAFQSGAVPAGGRIADEFEAGKPGMWFWDRALKADGSTTAHMFWDVASVERDGEYFGSIPGQGPGLIGANQNRLSRVIPATETGVRFPTRVTLSIWLEPVGLDVIDDLMATGHLPDDSVRQAMPRYFLNPKRLANPDGEVSPFILDWKRSEAVPSGAELCVSTENRP
jgi:hypothetical protein